MYLSRVELDLDKKQTQIALFSRNKFHGAIEEAFERNLENNRHLWRLDNLNGRKYLLIVSEEKPKLDNFINQYGKEELGCEIKKYDDFLNNIQENSVWKFRLVANPTKSLKQSNGRGKVVAHKTVDYQMQWLKEKAKKSGFDINTFNTTVVESKWLMFNKRGQRMIRILEVTFEGELSVTDVEMFKDILKNGIGRAKPYGMGMLTITRC